MKRKCSTLALKPDMNRSWLDPRPGGWVRGIDPDGDIDYFAPVNEGDPSTLPVRYVLVAPLPTPKHSPIYCTQARGLGGRRVRHSEVS